MRKRKSIMLVMILSLMLALMGCGKAVTQDMAMTESMSASAPKMESVLADGEFGMSENLSAEMKITEEQGQSQTAMEDRKLIKTVDMRVETKSFDQTMIAVKEKVEELGGYIESMETYNGSSYSTYRSTRNSNMTIRIPKQHLETFLETVSDISNVVRRSENVEDVTLTYVDLESHKKVLLTEQETLINLLKKAEAIEDIITIESRLSDVRYQIESMESQLRTFDNKVDYSTIYLDIEEVRELTPVKEETVWEQISGGFLKSLRDIKDGLVNFGIWFVVNIPYFVLWAIVLVAAILVIRGLLKLRAKNGGRLGRKMRKKKGDEIEKGDL